ncbi:hypothetical protein EDD15DRAFT_2375165 [Pisolithus albus]|nr:hypothetical protein EDD15DRAFT_2375165 [Pisolithus albus]
MGKSLNPSTPAHQLLPAPSTCWMLVDDTIPSPRNHFAHHAPTWTWVTKDGPNKGKSFSVPTIPVACERNAPKAVRWMVSVFHLFKAHLNPIAIDTDTGRVHQGWLCLYRSNMHLHLQSSLRASRPQRAPPLLSPLPPLPTYYGRSPAQVAGRAPCPPEHSTDASSEADPEEGSTHSPPPPPALTLAIVDPTTGLETSATDPPSWLVTVLSVPDLPYRFTKRHMLVPAPLSSSLPDATCEALRLRFEGASPFYLGISNMGALSVATRADRSLVSTTLNFPHDPSIPMLCP